MHRLRSLLFVFGLVLYLHPRARAATTFIDFEGFPDSTILTNQYVGLTFTNTIILTAGISLNEFEFPPHSEVNVASDNNGPISISFDGPILSFSGYFTYVEPLRVDAFDSGSNLVDSSTSAFSSNDALFGDPGSSPNEFLQVDFAGGISSVIITGDPSGGSFVMDDVTYTTVNVPEPRSIFLSLSGTVALLTLRRKIFLMRARLLLGAALLLLGAIGGVVLYAQRLATPNNALGDPNFGTVVPNQVVVIFSPSATPEQISGAISAVNGTVISTSSPLRMWQLKLPPSEDLINLRKALKTLSTYPGVESAYPNYSGQLY